MAECGSVVDLPEDMRLGPNLPECNFERITQPQIYYGGYSCSILSIVDTHQFSEGYDTERQAMHLNDTLTGDQDKSSVSYPSIKIRAGTNQEVVMVDSWNQGDVRRFSKQTCIPAGASFAPFSQQSTTYMNLSKKFTVNEDLM